MLSFDVNQQPLMVDDMLDPNEHCDNRPKSPNGGRLKWNPKSNETDCSGRYRCGLNPYLREMSDKHEGMSNWRIVKRQPLFQERNPVH